MDRTNPTDADALRSIPSVDAFLQNELFSGLPRSLLLREARRLLDEVRGDVLAGRIGPDALHALFGADSRDAADSAGARVRARCESAMARRHGRVVNATGIVLHTGIGRAPLADAAREAVAEAAGYAIVEVDPATGQRNQREEAVARLLCEVTGAEGALVVNNCAAMVNLTLRALGEDREVLVSRGELVEIGGGFRMPDVMAQARCRMVEVGATNRTHLRDYERAITAETAMIVKVHPSNFRILGFHSAPSLEELCDLGRRRELCVFEDLGSGLCHEDPVAGLEDEPRVQDSVRAGVPLVAFSGDKLLGGPQSGILIGDRELVARCRAHPLYRAFRCDKLTLAALEATLTIYRDRDPLSEIPTLRAIARPAAELAQLATDLAERLAALGGTVVESESFAGSGANPARPLPSFAVALPGGEQTAARLRQGPPPPVFARIEQDRVLLDLRTLADENLAEVAELVQQKLGGVVSS